MYYKYYYSFYFFFFSSRRRHTRSDRDWSSDVCSSDLQIFVERGYVASHQNETPIETNRFHADLFWIVRDPLSVGHFYDLRLATQQEIGRASCRERCRSRWSPYH